MKPTYSIRNWEKTFEVSQSRKARRLNWVAIPTKHDGKGYRRIMRKDPALYAAWIVLVQVAGKCENRGILADDVGPLDAADIEDATGCPSSLIEQAFAYLSSPEIGWLSVENATSNTVETCDKSGSDVPPPLPPRSQHGGSDVPPAVELRNVTRRNETEQDITSSCPKRFAFTDDDMATAKTIFELVQSVVPTAKKPNYDAWANSVRLMREQDQRTHDQIGALFRWANLDPFWHANILSPDTLRKQWDKLQAKRASQHGKQRTDNSPSKYDAPGAGTF